MEAGPELCQQLHVCASACVCVCVYVCVFLCSFLFLVWAGSEVAGCITARCAVLCAQHLCPTA